jgi:cytochrome c heme-lyase
MGWFWADAVPSAPRPVMPHPIPSMTDASPPPGCPMHNKIQSPKAVVEPAAPTTTPSACPYTPPNASTPKNTETINKLNPLNWMPSNISNKPAADQNYNLGFDRERSSIPKGDGTGNWEYPSPQQMYNALRRKGFDDTQKDAVEPMVAVHNFLNEGAWAEILEWERRFNKGIVNGVTKSVRGEAGTVHHAASEEVWDESEAPVPQLERFMGRPGQLTPKARMMQAAAWAFPNSFSQEPPFDRHDWFVRRILPDGTAREVRYVIDYYSGPPEDDGMPVFFLDVRPAIDTPSAAAARVVRWGGDVWYRGTGGEARERERMLAALKEGKS